VSQALDALAAGIAERLWTRAAAQDRLEALDEQSREPTLCQRLRARPELVDALVSEGLDEVLAAISAAPRRTRMRTLREHRDGGDAADGELMRAGLVTASWTGEAVSLSPAGDAALRLLDDLAERVAAAVHQRLAAQ
jgi:hypothetical protein